MKTVVKDYIKIRIHLLQLIALTLLMTILILSINDALDVWIYVITFLFSSIIVFRIIDDTFSVEADRKEHPERIYLIPTQFKLFKKVTAIIVGIYLLIIGLIFSSVFSIIFLLLTSSVVLYLLFRRHFLLLRLIPLLKYPVFLFCVATISNNKIELEVFLSSFLLMAGYDSFDAVKRNRDHIWKPILFLFCCSILLFKPWVYYINILFSLVPLLIIYIFRHKSFTPYFSIIFFPATYFILTLL